MTDLIRLTDVEKTYTRGKEKIAIFERLSMHIPQGDFIAIMVRRVQARPRCSTCLAARTERRAAPSSSMASASTR